MDGFYSRLKETILQLGKGKKLEEVIVGLGYIYVETGGEVPGLAYTFRFETDPTCSPLREAGTIKGRSVEEIAGWIYSNNLLKSGIAIATLNSSITPPENITTGDITLLPELGESSIIAMIGFFEPVAERLEKMGKTVYIFEKKNYEGRNFFTDSEIPEKLPKAEAVIITATTLINRTFTEIIKFVREGATAILLGPTAPLLPELYLDTPVKYIAGTVVTDREKVKQIIKEGAGSRVFGKSVKRVILPLS